MIARRDPVIITGLGAVTPLGHTRESIADYLLAGRSGVRTIEVPIFGHGHVQFAAPVEAIPDPSGIDRTAIAGFDRFDTLCTVAASRALADAFPDRDRGVLAIPPGRIGIVAGIGAGQLKTWETDFHAGGNRIFESRRDPSSVHRVAAAIGITGPAVTVGAACASSGYALAVARRWLELGWVDACIAGGCDVLTPSTIAAFHNLRALSRRSDDPAKASRPFDRDRDGFVMGEGGAFFVLEREADARSRGARLLASIAGVGMSSDAFHMVTPSADCRHAAAAITSALRDAGIGTDEVDYVNAHAAGTPVGDVAEAGAIHLALGDRAESVPVSSTKSMSGHLVSGAAAFEAVACIAAIERQAVPPTVNLDEPDDQCRLDHVRLVARNCPVRVTISNSFGFGGSNICLVLRQTA